MYTYVEASSVINLSLFDGNFFERILVILIFFFFNSGSPLGYMGYILLAPVSTIVMTNEVETSEK